MYSKTYKKIIIAVLIVLIGIGVCAILITSKRTDTVGDKIAVDEQEETIIDVQNQDDAADDEDLVVDGYAEADNAYTMPDFDEGTIFVYTEAEETSTNSETNNKKSASKEKDKQAEEDKEDESSETLDIMDYASSYFESLKKQNGYKKLSEDDEDSQQETKPEETIEPKKLKDDSGKDESGKDVVCTPPV